MIHLDPRWFPALILVFFTLYCGSAQATELCDEGALGLDDTDSTIRRLFYTGTCHYRNQDYPDAVTYWQQVTRIDAQTIEDSDLKIIALSNLGFMQFYGRGIEEDKNSALEYWQDAAQQGHDEAEYHICHAYADADEPTYHFHKAKQHCKKARHLYLDRQPEDDDILGRIDVFLDQLNRHSQVRGKQ